SLADVSCAPLPAGCLFCSVEPISPAWGTLGAEPLFTAGERVSMLAAPRIFSRRRTVASTYTIRLLAGLADAGWAVGADATVIGCAWLGTSMAPVHSNNALTWNNCSTPGRLGLSQAMMP